METFHLLRILFNKIPTNSVFLEFEQLFVKLKVALQLDRNNWQQVPDQQQYDVLRKGCVLYLTGW